MGEKPTPADLTALREDAVHIGGIAIGDWGRGDGKPLHPFFQEMVDTIGTWFNPNQGWQLEEVRWGIINRDRIRRVLRFETPLRPDKKTEPDQYTIFFHYSVSNPPMHRSWRGQPTTVDFSKIFSEEGMKRINFVNGAVNTVAGRVGSVFPLQEAIKTLASPYYLVGMAIQPTALEDKRITVMVMMRDLDDFLRLRGTELRRAQRGLEGKFGSKVKKPKLEFTEEYLD